MPKAKRTRPADDRKPIEPLDLDDNHDGWRFIATLAELRGRAESQGVPWLDAWAAYQLACIAIQALAGVPVALEEVRRIEAFRRGASGPRSDALAIVEMAQAVALRAIFWKRRTDPFYVNIGLSAPASLRAWLVGKYPDREARLPSVDELTDWLGRQAERGARGKLTTAGIVANIVHLGQLLGARGGRQKSLERVTKVLKRTSGGTAPDVRPDAPAPRASRCRR